jgi:16S rRNA (guanine966-N2)-methyltransferase
MRITGGNQKGKTIQTVKGQDVRPTSSKVRESIFNIIQLNESGTVFYEGETTMLDLFAGSGVMGLEALSRGAKKVVFVEKNPYHAEIIRKNLQNFGNVTLTKLIISDALKALDKIEEKFNFIFIDPPYASELYVPVLKKIQENKILSQEGFIILEHSSSLNIEEIVCKAGFKIYKAKTYGDTGITVVRN